MEGYSNTTDCHNRDQGTQMSRAYLDLRDTMLVPFLTFSLSLLLTGMLMNFHDVLLHFILPSSCIFASII